MQYIVVDCDELHYHVVGELMRNWFCLLLGFDPLDPWTTAKWTVFEEWA